MMNSNIEKRVILPWSVVVVVVISCVSSCVSGFNLVYQRGQQGKRNVGLLKKEEPFIPLSFQGLYMSSSSSMNEDELRNQKAESIQSLSDYHDGTWICKDGATSFTISSDTAAGIIQKSTSSPYQTSVNIRFSKGGLKMVETFSWQEQELTTAVTRSVPLIGPSIDVDAVDASYSIDQTLMDLPSTISGTDSIVKFGIEHVLSIQDNVRVRAFCFYGMDDRLSRIVLTNEERQQSLKSLLLQDEDEEMSNNIEQLFSSKKKENQMEKIKQILNNNNNDPDKNNTLKNHPITLFGLSLGPWLGDSVIRDQSLFHTKQNKSNNNNNNKGGFGSSSKPTNLSKNNNNDELSSSNQPLDGFAEWTLGVQKVAMLYKWDFDETIRQVNELGRSMGPSYCSTLPKSSMGIINEKLMSRRIPKEDRMLYIDYDMGAYAGFTLGSIYLKVPTFLFFSQMDADKLVLPFVTEFAVFQKDTTDDNNKDDESFDTEDDMNGEIICSKMMRVYDNHGRLKQGITSFYTLKPMATEADKMDP